MHKWDLPAAPKAERHPTVAQGSVLNDEEVAEGAKESEACKAHWQQLLPEEDGEPAVATPLADLVTGSARLVDNGVSCNLDSWATFFLLLLLCLTWLLVGREQGGHNAWQMMVWIVLEMHKMTKTLLDGQSPVILFVACGEGEHGMSKVGCSRGSCEARKVIKAALVDALFGQLHPKGWQEHKQLIDLKLWQVSCKDQHFVAGACGCHLVIGHDSDMAFVRLQCSHDSKHHYWLTWHAKDQEVAIVESRVARCNVMVELFPAFSGIEGV